ncbi:MAG: GreA/GreB family elongation factor [Syntrophobacterales bacterium]|nr:GreA/GreB family elongation factor [Syntrophobacterales bacterium]
MNDYHLIISRREHIRLLDKLTYLHYVVKPRIIEEVQNARIWCHRRDNSEYFDAKLRLSRLYANIEEIEVRITQSEILVGCRSYSDRILVGATVTVQNLENNEISRYVLVGPHESDVHNGYLSIASPLGSALLGHKTGDEIIFEAPSGIKTYRVISVEWK